MSVNQKIESALNNIVTSIWPLYCPEERPPDEYIVYNPELEEAVLFGDNADTAWVHHMQVHYFTKSNYILKRKEIREALHTVGFLVTDLTTLHEKDSGYNHLCFSCSIEEDMEV